MYTQEALLDMHARGHRSLGKVLAHCEQLSAEEIERIIPGFDEGTLRLRLHHIIGGEDYWIGVLRGTILVDDKPEEYPTIATLQAYRERVAAETDSYLRAASADELNTPRVMTVWSGEQRELMPARVFLRTLTHIYHHLGQVLIMCRVMGRPGEGMDFPIGP
jgi:uncharacterized damage-inducible protein DinB